jgi:aspartyl-tRNA(Asn)/glutamyl-tRNA(Gln) amidotransferase subunit B
MKKSCSVLDKYPDYEVVIGIEVHVQLTTKTKIFCSCPNTTAAEQNQNICQICAGHPGVLPVLNKAVMHNAVKAGLATFSTINSPSYFDRKHYFYPDLPKGYQITQQFFPVCTDGHVMISDEEGNEKKIRLKRIHIEEDAGKNTHLPHTSESLIDLNRAGTPLLEMVSEPDIRSAHQAREYLKNLRAIVQYLGICSGNMQEGAFRADTNISVRKKGAEILGTKCELKNINSFKFIADAIEYEIERQINLVQSGQSVKQETRLWDSKNKHTIAMRSKEEAADYRYFQDPDLQPLFINKNYIDQIKKELPELPFEKIVRYTSNLGLSLYEAEILVEDQAVAHYFEKAYAKHPSKTTVNWIIRDLLGAINENNQVTITECTISPESLAELAQLIDKGTINNSSARKIFEIIFNKGGNPTELVKSLGLEQIGSSDELEAIVKAVIGENQADFEAYKAGKDKLLGFFVGQVMKKTGGKGNPKMIQELLAKEIK